MSKQFKFSKTAYELLFLDINLRHGGRKLRLLVILDTGKVKKGNIYSRIRPECEGKMPYVSDRQTLARRVVTSAGL